MERKLYVDGYNKSKVWEVTCLKGGFYLKEYVAGKQHSRGVKLSLKKLKKMGILNGKIVKNLKLYTLNSYFESLRTATTECEVKNILNKIKML